MARDFLETFVEEAKAAWAPLTTETAAIYRHLLEELTKAPAAETWLAELYEHPPFEGKELYRDPEHGFLLLTFTEREGLYRPPHDHGRGWVIYAVQQGELEMGTFVRVTGPHRTAYLVKRESYRVHTGECRVYLPGDIHDTRCISGTTLMYRFTSCDLKREDQEGRMTRYIERDGTWTVRTA